VFHITEGGLHGLEAAPADQGRVTWGCYGIPINGADGTAVWTGAQNTIDILAGCNEANIAAKKADDYTLGGYSDWYLPSKDELNLLYLQKDVVGGFIREWYWCSTDNNSNNAYAWAQSFDGGAAFNFFGKSLALPVRAVRDF
jgi:hypothetical protein